MITIDAKGASSPLALQDAGNGAKHSQLQFRALQEDDVLVVKELQSTLFPVQYPDGFYTRLFTPGYYCQVGLINGIIVTVASARVVDYDNYSAAEVTMDAAREAYIMTLGVRDGYRRHRLGSRAMAQILEILTLDTKAEYAALHVKAANRAAVRFYETNGWECSPRDGFLPNHYRIDGVNWDAYRYTHPLRVSNQPPKCMEHQWLCCRSLANCFVTPHHAALDNGSSSSGGSGGGSSSSKAYGKGDAFAVTALSGKGYGCIARRNIQVGERLLAEAPMIQRCPGSRTLADSIEALSAEDRSAFFQLSQNEARFGRAPTAEGIYQTNALPCHHHATSHGGIFPMASRFNHSCDESAVFKWNGNLNKLTVHASRSIAKGEEICFNYGSPNGCVLHEERRRRLKDAFGFECDCSKCELRGEALRQSEERLAVIGDTSTLLSELCEIGSLPTLVSVDAHEVLGELEERMRLIRQECPNGHFRGLDAFLKNFVEFCEASAARLFEIVREAPPGVDALIFGEQPARLADLHAKALMYMAAARSWAVLARDVTRDLKGVDSPAYEIWTAALLRDGFWSATEGGGGGITIGRLDFYAAWIAAGLGAPGPRIADVIHERVGRIGGGAAEQG